MFRAKPDRRAHRFPLGAFALSCFLLGPGTPCLAAPPAGSQSPDPVEALAARIRQHISAPRFAAATWGIQIVSLDTRRVWFETNAGKYFVPASNAKLFTAALALQELGPGFRIRTSVYGAARPGADGVLPGDLVLFGRGDPSVLRPWNGGPGQDDPLESLARQIQDQGVRVIQGDLVGDDRFFDAPPYCPGAEWEDLQFPYGAEPTALTLHDNRIDLWVYPAPLPGRPCFLFAQPGHGLVALRNGTATLPAGQEEGVAATRYPGETAIQVTGSLAVGAAPVRLRVPVRDAALGFARLLQRALARHGIQVRGQVRAAHASDRTAPLDPARLVELGHLESPPLRSLVRDLLKDSDNLASQLMLLQVGALPGSGPGGTVQAGLAALDAWMARLGLAPGGALLEEGSGLSRKNLVKPEAIVQLLAAMDRQPEASAFREALPIAGVDGTLRRRMLDTAAQGNVRAKTGTLLHTHALSGYATRSTGERLAFAILLNNDAGLPAPQAELDAIAVLLAQ